MGEMTVLQKQEVAKGAQAMGSLMGRYAKRKSERVTSPLKTLSFWGQILAVAAALAMLVSAGLVIFDASHITIDRGRVAFVAADTVNVRNAPTTRSQILTKAHYGDRFTVTGRKGEWTRLTSSRGDVTGWISSSLLTTESARTFVFRYEMKGYMISLVISLLVVFFALRMKKIHQTQAAGQSARTMLVNQDQ